MAFTPQYYSNYNLSSGFCEFPPASGGDGVGLAMWCEENLPLFDNIMNGVGNYMVPSESDMTSSSISTMSFPQEYDSSQATWNMQATHVPEMNTGFAVGNQPEGCEFGEECSGFASNFWSAQYSTTTNSWKIKGEQAVQESEEPAMKIGRYSVEERKDRISRYLKKRNQRNFNKTIKYACRKTLADKRVRVRGRFAKNNEASSSDQDETVMKNKKNLQQDTFNTNFFQIKHDDDEWIEAVASFMYLPYING